MAQEDRPTWKLAVPGWQYAFPADHGVHRSFKTEWWYFTGNLRESAAATRTGMN